MIHDKYNRLLIDKLPTEVGKEFNQIKTDTENFSDDELIDIYKDNFNELFKIVESKYPEALKPKKKLIKSAKMKVIKKAEPKKKLVKKDVKKKLNADCDDAVKELKQIESKKAQAVKARAEAPKKKVSTAAREKQVNALKSLFKTKDFKGNPLAMQIFSKKIINAYKNSGEVSKSFSDQLENDINELIEKTYPTN